MMDLRPVFFQVDDRNYRLHFPYMLAGFEMPMLQKDDDRVYDSSERNYMIAGFTYGSDTYDIRVREVGADIAPGSIEAYFYTGGVAAEIPADLRGFIAERNEAATQKRTLVYINGMQLP